MRDVCLTMGMKQEEETILEVCALESVLQSANTMRSYVVAKSIVTVVWPKKYVDQKPKIRMDCSVQMIQTRMAVLSNVTPKPVKFCALPSKMLLAYIQQHQQQLFLNYHLTQPVNAYVQSLEYD